MKAKKIIIVIFSILAIAAIGYGIYSFWKKQKAIKAVEDTIKNTPAANKAVQEAARAKGVTYQQELSRRAKQVVNNSKR